MVKAVNKTDILEPVDIQRILSQCPITLETTWQPVTPDNLDMRYLCS
jgi:hypothetical protein